MWFMAILLCILVGLILIVIMDTSMKLALMITTLYNYETKKLFIPATLTVILWTILFIGCFNSINVALDNNALDIIFTMIFEHSILDQYKATILKTLISTFLIGTLLQSFTYYAVNINYQKVTGRVRFSFKKLIKKLTRKVFKSNDTQRNRKNYALTEVEKGPKKLTFWRAIVTSIISMLITLVVCYGLLVLGNTLSDDVLKIL